jgi:hypothetical protein
MVQMGAHTGIRHHSNVINPMNENSFLKFENIVIKFHFRGSYYSLRIRPRFRVIVLNTNYCFRLNFWSLYNPRNPANHLKWLAQELLTAEQVSDSVHIVGHIVPDRRECNEAGSTTFWNLSTDLKTQ